MQSLLPLKPFIGLAKTLVITCHGCFQPEVNERQVYTYQCLGNMLRKDDELQQACISYFIEVKQCTQIILAGHYDCQVIQKVLAGASSHSPIAIFQYNIEKLIEEYTSSLLQPAIKDRMLIELNILEQLKLLMRYDFIYKKVNKGLLKVMGVVLDSRTQATAEIFRNGLTFNNLVVSN